MSPRRRPRGPSPDTWYAASGNRRGDGVGGIGLVGVFTAHHITMIDPLGNTVNTIQD